MSEAPLVTVLIPARNEEEDIERCLHAVLAQHYPHDRMEIVLVDGGSTDATARVAREALVAGDIGWRMIDNPAGTTPSNLNAGLAVASGELLCRVDARSIIPADYLQLCVEVLLQYPEIVVTGGAQSAVALGDSVRSAGIARALNNRYAMGWSRYRSGASSGASDTVYLGAFRTGQLRAIGGWNELFETNQDYELNRTMSLYGTVWFDERLAVEYIPRQSLGALWKQYHRFGRWKVRYWLETGDPPRSRQLLPLLSLSACITIASAIVARRPSRGPVIVLVGAAALLGVDHLGASSTAGVAVRANGAAVSGLVGVAWMTGVFQGLIAEGMRHR